MILNQDADKQTTHTQWVHKYTVIMVDYSKILHGICMVKTIKYIDRIDKKIDGLTAYRPVQQYYVVEKWNMLNLSLYVSCTMETFLLDFEVALKRMLTMINLFS